jgi:hypothetical protein
VLRGRSRFWSWVKNGVALKLRPRRGNLNCSLSIASRGMYVESLEYFTLDARFRLRTATPHKATNINTEKGRVHEASPLQVALYPARPFLLKHSLQKYLYLNFPTTHFNPVPAKPDLLAPFTHLNGKAQVPTNQPISITGTNITSIIPIFMNRPAPLLRCLPALRLCVRGYASRPRPRLGDTLSLEHVSHSPSRDEDHFPTYRLNLVSPKSPSSGLVPHHHPGNTPDPGPGHPCRNKKDGPRRV